MRGWLEAAHGGVDETTARDVEAQVRGNGGDDSAVARALEQLEAERPERVLWLRPELIGPFNLFSSWLPQCRTGGMSGMVTGMDMNLLYAWAGAPGRRIDGVEMRWLEKCFRSFEGAVVSFYAERAKREEQGRAGRRRVR